MPSRETLKYINGDEALANLDAARAEKHGQERALHTEKIKLLGEVASEGGLVSPKVAQEVSVQAQHNTGEVPVVTIGLESPSSGQIAPPSHPQ